MTRPLASATLLLVLFLVHCVGVPTGDEDGLHAMGKTNRFSDNVGVPREKVPAPRLGPLLEAGSEGSRLEEELDQADKEGLEGTGPPAKKAKVAMTAEAKAKGAETRRRNAEMGTLRTLRGTQQGVLNAIDTARLEELEADAAANGGTKSAYDKARHANKKSIGEKEKADLEALLEKKKSLSNGGLDEKDQARLAVLEEHEADAAAARAARSAYDKARNANKKSIGEKEKADLEALLEKKKSLSNGGRLGEKDQARLAVLEEHEADAAATRAARSAYDKARRARLRAEEQAEKAVLEALLEKKKSLSNGERLGEQDQARLDELQSKKAVDDARKRLHAEQTKKYGEKLSVLFKELKKLEKRFLEAGGLQHMDITDAARLEELRAKEADIKERRDRSDARARRVKPGDKRDGETDEQHRQRLEASQVKHEKEKTEWQGWVDSECGKVGNATDQGAAPCTCAEYCASISSWDCRTQGSNGTTGIMDPPRCFYRATSQNDTEAIRGALSGALPTILRNGGFINRARTLEFFLASLREQICPGFFGGKGDNKLSAATSFSTNKYVCLGFAHDHWRRHDRHGNPRLPGPGRSIILLDGNNPEICMIDMLKHIDDLDPKLPRKTKNWLKSGVEEYNAITTPHGIRSGYQPVGRDARARPDDHSGGDIKPGDRRYIPEVKYGMTSDIGDTDFIMSRRARDQMDGLAREALEEHLASGRGRLHVFSSSGGRDGHPVFCAAKILKEFGMNHERSCHLIVGGNYGFGRIQQALFLGGYNEACDVENFRNANDSSAKVMPPCSIGTINALKALLLKQGSESGAGDDSNSDGEWHSEVYLSDHCPGDWSDRDHSNSDSDPGHCLDWWRRCPKEWYDKKTNSIIVPPQYRDYWDLISFPGSDENDCPDCYIRLAAGGDAESAGSCHGIYVASKSGEEEDEEDGEEEEEEKKKKRKKMESAGACLGIHVASELGEEDDEEEKKKKKRKSKSKGKSKSKSKSKSKRKDEEDEDEGDDEQDDEEDEEDEEGCNTTDGMPAPVSSPPAFDDAPPGGIKGPEDKAPEVVSFCESILLFYTGLGMELVSVPGDGACLFYCLASWIKVFRTILWSTLMGAVPVAGDTVRVAREVECASAEDANTVRSAAVDYMQKYGVLNGWHGSIVPVTPEGAPLSMPSEHQEAELVAAWGDYCTYMRGDTIWGDHIEIAALSQRFECTIVCHSFTKTDDGRFRVVRTDFPYRNVDMDMDVDIVQADADVCYICFFSGHYWLARGSASRV